MTIAQESNPHELLIDLLTYVEQVEKLNQQPAREIPADAMLGHQADIQQLPGVRLDVAGSWLSLARLKKTLPPAPSAEIVAWISIFDDPRRRPELKEGAPSFLNTPSSLDDRDHRRPSRPLKDAFEAYVEGAWTEWADAEREARDSRKLYDKVFLLHQSISQDSAEAPVELVWGVGMAAWQVGKTKIRHPLISQACSISVDPNDFTISISPASAPPRLEVDCYAEDHPGAVKRLEALWSKVFGSGSDEPRELNPFDEKSFGEMLRLAVAEICSSGSYDNAAKQPPPLGPSLAVSSSWALFTRKRGDHFLMMDLERLKALIEKRRVEGLALPDALRAFVTKGADEVSLRDEANFRGLSSSSVQDGVRDLYFPMPYNQEQVAIAQQLEFRSGVVVQGPPGTGKTHTIANIVCHYLAQGKKVLVTAKGETALSVLRDKIPESIKPLCVALLTSEKDGAKQFERSVGIIASEVASLSVPKAEMEIAEAEALIDATHASIIALDEQISEFALARLAIVEVGAKRMRLEEVARMLAEKPGALWIEHSAMPGDEGVMFSDDDIFHVGQARIAAGDDIGSLGEELPPAGLLPSMSSMGVLHADLQEMGRLRNSWGAAKGFQRSDARNIPKMSELSADVASLARAKEEIASAGAGWVARFEQLCIDSLARDSLGAVGGALAIAANAIEVEGRRQELMMAAAAIPAQAELDADFLAALDRLAAGGKAFSLPWIFGSAKVKDLIARSTVARVRPSCKDDWAKVAAHARMRLDARRCVARWNALAEDIGAPKLPETDLERSGKRMASLGGAIKTCMEAAKLALRVDQGQLELFGSRQSLELPEDVHALAQKLDGARRLAELAEIAAQRDALRGMFAPAGGPIGAKILELFDAGLGGDDLTSVDVEFEWGILMGAIERARSLAEEFAVIERVSGLVALSGASGWARALRDEPADVEGDRLTSEEWRQAWEWRQMDNLLNEIDKEGSAKQMFVARRGLEASLARAYQELVGKKTWLGVKRNCTEAVQQRLQQYLNAVQAMGKGTGKRAARHRETARDAMAEAHKAISCWIMPHWRVSESLPAEMGLFDLVVIDEASQSDMWALPALMRGAQVLIVGDHKQVSPSAVGVKEEDILMLGNRFLSRQPNGTEMTPDKSIYDLARVVFAGNSIMLKEHFRSVPAIIEFSNQAFYHGDIKPLRSPKLHEKMSPPLVDVLVRGGFRKNKGDSNPPEARAILDEMKALIADAAHKGRTMGVVTLLGSEQAALITKMVHDEIDPSEIMARQIAIGVPSTFQGRERDVIFLSMILEPGNRAVSDRLESEQRFNVAMSRARDRVYLFRSVKEQDFKPDTLTAKLIRHFRTPFAQSQQVAQTLRDKCESPFEIEMFDFLSSKGYRVLPQFACGGFRIDFVVEGAGGQRLAVECDGDRYHGPDKWLEDMARQRVLERAGWVFWRSFASAYTRRPREVQADLLAALSAQGIEPQPEGASEGGDELVEFREVFPDLGADDVLAQRQSVLDNAAAGHGLPASRTHQGRNGCESDFEREIFDFLHGQGYAVETQAKALGFRIDLVAHGESGQRLAIECDGDRFHGAEKWAEDNARQKVLENAGWIFWRSFASAYARGKEEVQADLIRSLDAQGIRPMAQRKAEG